ncbi:MAG: DEAD/DEAH box helicase [Bacteroidales bacterium]|nr:DEAD/DEAH box helicase [Bacteroidales bacterium]
MEAEQKELVTFDNFKINKSLRKAIEEIGFIYPTPIQKQSFPVIMSGKNIVGIAQTGTGKTLAYLLPILQMHQFNKEKDPKVLILVPTRELVQQVVEEIEQLSAFFTLKTIGIYGGVNINTQKEIVFQGCDVLVATPGRLLDINLTGVLKLSKIKKLVIDEVDEMMNLGFRPQLTSILERLPNKRQNMMFSATMLPEIETIIHDFFNLHEKIEIAPHGTPLEQIEQQKYFVPNFYTKVNLLKWMLSEREDFSKVLIFVESKKLADRLFDALDGENNSTIGVIHANKSQNYRFRMVEAFENEDIKILIATDLLARGLDIDNVSHVINFDLPQTPVHYIHRIGRTGRYDKNGEAISFVNEAEKVLLEDIENLMQMEIPTFELPETVEISDIISDDEKESVHQKQIVKVASIKDTGGAFHEKSEKKQKINSGSPAFKRKKHKKPIKRSGRKK